MCIKATKRFLRASSILPNEISQRFPEIIEKIEQQHPPDRRKIGNCGFWRTRITSQYRLFYRYEDGCLCLLDLRKRDNHTYRHIELLNEQPLLEIDEPEEPTEQQNLLSKEQIYQCHIPDRYHRELLSIKSEEDLTYSNHQIPYKYIAEIIDILDRPIRDVSKEAYFDVPRSEYLAEYCLHKNLNQLLLSLSEEQKRIVELETDGAILVKGGPGTGKSILAIHRIKKLVDRRVCKILFTTHNETLVDYFKQLLSDLVADALDRGQVEVRTVDNIVDEYNRECKFKPANQEISIICLKSAIRNVDLKKNIREQIEKLGELLILEEILGTIESRGITEVDDYKKISHIGEREGNLHQRRELRQAIWDIYTKWKEILQKSGYMTIEQSRRKALSDVVKIRREHKPYDAVIIDEAQDLSPTSLKLLIKLVKSPSGIFVTADTSQSLYENVFCWNFIDKEIYHKSTVKFLTKSFRNTQEIGEACPQILVRKYDRKNTVTADGLSNIRGAKPKVLLTDDVLERKEKIINFLEREAKYWKLSIFSGAILVPDEYLGLFISNQLNYGGYAAKWLDRKIADNDEESGFIQVMSLAAAKGLEFPFVAIVGLEEHILPSCSSNPESAQQRELLDRERRLFYVGCSRAMRALLVCGSKSKPSCLINDLQAENWDF